MNHDYNDTPVDCSKNITKVINLPIDIVYECFTKPELYIKWYGFIGLWIKNVFDYGFEFTYIQDYSGIIVFTNKNRNTIDLTQKIVDIVYPPAEIHISLEEKKDKTNVSITITANMPLYWFEIFDSWEAIDEIEKESI